MNVPTWDKIQIMMWSYKFQWRIQGGVNKAPIPPPPLRVLFFHFDIQILRNIAAFGVGAPYAVGTHPTLQEMLDPPLNLLFIIYTTVIKRIYFNGRTQPLMIKKSNLSNENSLAYRVKYYFQEEKFYLKFYWGSWALSEKLIFAYTLTYCHQLFSFGRCFKSNNIDAYSVRQRFITLGQLSPVSELIIVYIFKQHFPSTNNIMYERRNLLIWFIHVTYVWTDRAKKHRDWFFATVKYVFKIRMLELKNIEFDYKMEICYMIVLYIATWWMSVNKITCFICNVQHIEWNTLQSSQQVFLKKTSVFVLFFSW